MDGIDGDELRKEYVRKDLTEFKIILKDQEFDFNETTDLGSIFRISHTALAQLYDINGKMATPSGDGGNVSEMIEKY